MIIIYSPHYKQT